MSSIHCDQYTLRMARTVSSTNLQSRNVNSLPSRSYSPDSNNEPESRSKSTKDAPGRERGYSNTERDCSSARSLSLRSRSPHSSSNDSSDISCSMNSRQRCSSKKRRVMEKFGNNEHKSSLERHDRKEQEEHNRIEQDEYNRYSLNVTFDMIII